MRRTRTDPQLCRSPSSEDSAHPPGRLQGDQEALRSSRNKKRKNVNLFLGPVFFLCLAHFFGVEMTLAANFK